MPTIGAKPFTLMPRGVSDTIDGTNSFPGAMAQLSNLIPSPKTRSVFVPRPASVSLADFAGFTTPGAISVVGVFDNYVYGLISTGRFAGKDEPFVYDLAAQAFLTLQGVTSDNCPTTQSAAGDWVPPVIASITASKILVTHIGFPGGSGAYFGGFDISGFSTTALKGNITSGSNVITSIYDGDTSAPILDGVSPGQLITGAGIPAGATVVSATNGTFSLNTTGDVHGTTTLDGLASTTGVAPGMIVTGPDFSAGTYVVSVDSSTQVTLSAAALTTATGASVNFSGGGTITISANATATTNLLALTISGGTQASPLWFGANTNTNPLVSVPVSVAQFNGRAYFAVGNKLVFSDSLNPTQVTNATQALTFGGGDPVTAVSGLPLSNQVTGGIVQSLIVFKGAGIMYQVTGDQATSDLKDAAINGSVGTLAPASICATPLGLMYISPDGLRVINAAGQVSQPIGARGDGVAQPFQLTTVPSRMAAAFNQNTYRVSLIDTQLGAPNPVEYWYDLTQALWTGPHSFPACAIAPISEPGQIGFVLGSASATGNIWFSTCVPDLSSAYVENGTQLSCAYQTSPLPDNQEAGMNSIIRSLLAASLPYGQPVVFTALDEGKNIIDQISITLYQNPYYWDEAYWDAAYWPGGVDGNAVWGSFVWGTGLWGGELSPFREHNIPWSVPLVFKQCSVKVECNAVGGLALGNMYLKYRVLGYTNYDAI